MAVIQSAYVHGVSTRKVDDLVQALGLSGIGRSKVSRICRELDEAVTAFRNRPLEGGIPVRVAGCATPEGAAQHRIVNMAVVIAIGVRETGEREILAIDVGAGEEEAFWKTFLRGVVRPGPRVPLMITTDGTPGLIRAVTEVWPQGLRRRRLAHKMRRTRGETAPHQSDPALLH
jgi:transposase-like protein